MGLIFVVAGHFCFTQQAAGPDNPTTMSEGESKQVPDSAQEGKPESMAGQAVSSVSPPVSMVTQPPATAATEDEEEESEDESEILEESPCGRWQKRREEVEDCFSSLELLISYQPTGSSKSSVRNLLAT